MSPEARLNVQRAATALVCGYEVVALVCVLTTGRQVIPTVSEVCWRHPVLGWALIALAARHFVVDSPHRRWPPVNAHR